MKNRFLKLIHLAKYTRFKVISKKKIKTLLSKIESINDVWLNRNVNKALSKLELYKLHPEKEFIKKYYSVNRNRNLSYIHEYDYKYFIEPKMNNRRYAVAFGDKGLIDYHLARIPGIDLDIIPRIVIRNIDNTNYDNLFNHINQKEFEKVIKDLKVERIIFKKNLDTGGGRDVCFFEKTTNKFINDIGVELLEYVENKSNYIIQVAIKQHALMNGINSSSINTIRIITYRSVKDNRIHTIQSFIRFGKEGCKYDNFDKGGGIVNINKDGKLDRKVLSNEGELNNFKFSGMQIPQYEIIIEVAHRIAQHSYFSRILGFDFAIDDNSQIKLLEINYGGINPEPSNVLKGPLFGKYSEEVLEYCKDVKANIVLKGKTQL